MKRRGFFGAILKGAAAAAAAPIAVKLAETVKLSEAAAPSPIAVEPEPVVSYQSARDAYKHVSYGPATFWLPSTSMSSSADPLQFYVNHSTGGVVDHSFDKASFNWDLSS